jgi:hypothetical protein
MASAGVNRVNEEISQWQEKEKQLTKLFPDDIRLGRESIKNTVGFYKSILDRYKLTGDPDEKRSLLLLRVQVKEMENKLYPSPLSKLFRSRFWGRKRIFRYQ